MLIRDCFKDEVKVASSKEMKMTTFQDQWKEEVVARAGKLYLL